MALAPLLRRSAAFLAGMAVLVLLAEVSLRVLPVVQGNYAADARPDWPIRTLVPNAAFTYSNGWDLENIHHGRINNFGYMAPFDYTPGSSGIVVIGDSYVEAMMNDYRDTLQGALPRYLRAPQAVMPFGTSGADMPHYLGASYVIREHFRPEWAVYVVSDGDFEGGFAADHGYYRWAPGRFPPIELVPEITRSSLAKTLRTVALVRYLRGNLTLRVSDVIGMNRAQPEPETEASACKPAVLSARDEELAAAFVDALPRALQLGPERIILILDADRRGIYAGRAEDAEPCPTHATLIRKRLATLAMDRHIHVIDSRPVFERHYRTTHRKLDFLPRDLHWNAAAHDLMAQEVARIVNGENAAN
jgi:hypothetical protein